MTSPRYRTGDPERDRLLVELLEGAGATEDLDQLFEILVSVVKLAGDHADRLNLKIVDIPIRYCDRTYGSTNISRWRHGLLLARMLLTAVKKIKFA